MYNVNAYYDVIVTLKLSTITSNGAFFFVTYNKWRHNVQWRKNIFPLFISKHKFYLFSYNLRHKWRLSVRDRWSYYIL